MKQEKLECGNEFGSEVQATVAAVLTRNMSLCTEKKEALTALVLDSVNLDVPKYVALRGTELHKVLKESIVRDYDSTFARYLEDARRAYFCTLSVLHNNRVNLVDPKNRLGSQGGSAGSREGALFA